MNKVILVGNLGADAEIVTTPNGTELLKIRLATPDRRQKDGVWQDSTEWHNIVLFGKSVKALGPHLTKGKGLVVEGKLSTSSWDKDGEKRYKTEVVAYSVRFAPSSNPPSHRAAPQRAEAPVLSGARVYTGPPVDPNDECPF